MFSRESTNSFPYLSLSLSLWVDKAAQLINLATPKKETVNFMKENAGYWRVFCDCQSINEKYYDQVKIKPMYNLIFCCACPIASWRQSVPNICCWVGGMHAAFLNSKLALTSNLLFFHHPSLKLDRRKLFFGGNFFVFYSTPFAAGKLFSRFSF